MKKIIYFIIGIGFISILGSCSNWLEEKPKAVAAETFYNTNAEAEAAVAAPLNNFRTLSMSYFGLNECFADYCYGRGSWEDNSNYTGLNTTNMNRAYGLWNSFYSSIRNCNIPLQKLPLASSLTEEQKKSYMGELKFIRAFCYHNIVFYWNGGPLRTEENMDSWDLAKSSASDIYDFIVSDLKYAIENAPSVPRLCGTPCKNAARALLALVQEERKNYSEAKTLCEDVINSGQYSLVEVSTSRDFDNIFGPNVSSSTEEIFYAKSSRTNNTGMEYAMFCAHPSAKIDGKKMHGAGGWYGIYTTDANEMISTWDAKDLRKDFNLLKHDFGMGSNTYLHCKFYDPDAAAGWGANVNAPFMRYADVLLLYAEAATMAANNPTEDAMEKLNMVHRRAYGRNPNAASDIDYKLSDYSTKEKFMELLSKEQAYENYNEGKRWQFLVRNGMAREQVKKIKGLDIADKHFLFPIPTTEFDYNKAMDATKDQNPGY